MGIDRDTFIKGFNESIDQHFDSLRPYYDHHLFQLTELEGLKFQILNCIMLKMHEASICTTNHFLERALKVSLIHLYTLGLTYLDKNYNHKVQEAHNKYDGKNLPQTLRLSFNENLLSKDEFDYLVRVKAQIRDPYSHAQIGIINKGVPKSMASKIFSFESIKLSLRNNVPLEEPENIHPSTLSPAIAQHFQSLLAEKLSFTYFRGVYNIVIEIEKRLKVFRSKKGKI